MKTVFPFLLLFIQSVFIQSVCSSNILYISSMPFRSYHIWNQKLAFELVERGHNVTFARTFKTKLLKRENYTEILIEGVHEAIRNNAKRLFEWDVYSSVRVIMDAVNTGILFCRTSVESKGLSYLLESYKDFKFDLIIFDLTTGTCFYPIMKHFDYPLAIGVTQFPLPFYVDFNFDGQLNPAYIPWYRLPYDNEMTFFERMWNFIFTYLHVAMRYAYQHKHEHKIAQTIFGNDIPSIEILERNISLLFTNVEPILNYAQPTAPNIIPVGGLHLTEPKKLPKDLQKILDGAKNGAIVFSLGSILQGNDLSQKMQENLLDAFSQIQETVLWKFDGEIENVPRNVIVRKWFPQSDILGHPNVKLFIGHGGALSTQEALYHGVPIFCIPFYADQHITAKLIEKRKFGVTLSLYEIESKIVFQKLEKVLRNSVYSKNMKKASKMFRNKKETPLERAAFWIEYLLEFGDVDFLSTTSRDLPFYKSSGLDVLLFLVSVVAILILLCYKWGQVISTLLRNKVKLE